MTPSVEVTRGPNHSSDLEKKHFKYQTPKPMCGFIKN